MKTLINNIKMPVKHSREDVLAAACDIARRRSLYAQNLRIYRCSIDARRKNDIHYVYSVSADLPDGTDLSHIGEVTPLADGAVEIIPLHTPPRRPVVVGMGPCGLFAAYILALRGVPPLIIEMGESIEKRVTSVDSLWRGGRLNRHSNVQFGEGGAGTFSDGKLNTGIKDKRQRFILKTFVRFGAPEDILTRAKPHIGTDRLRGVIINMRRELIRLGCEVRFGTKLTGLDIKNGRLCGAVLDDSERIPADMLFLAIGHSSRDTYEMLLRSGVRLEPKPFAAGVRIEHKQSFIGRAQYGDIWRELPPADYKLVYNGRERSCYSFCMCPGGRVVNASSEEGRLVVNGMSDYNRDAVNANSALVVSVRPDDFDGGALGGIEFQRRYEELAFRLGGGGYTAPVQLARDFLNDRKSVSLRTVRPSYTGKTALCDLRECLPEFIVQTLKAGLMHFEGKIKGFSLGDAVMTGVEMRTSAPVKIPRGDDFAAEGIAGLYPLGEGAGCAGGIVSAALDGIRAVLSLK